MKLERLINQNTVLRSAIASTINEYDIESAHPTAMRFIAGEALYQDLMKLDKLKRNTEIGKMMLKDPTLYPKIEALLLEWMNEFIDTNNLQLSQHVIETTRDSLLVLNRIPKVTKFRDGKVNFRNKDGSFSSFFRVGNKLILFDCLSGGIRIKGIDKSVVEQSPFVKKYLLPFLSAIETLNAIGPTECLKILKRYRERYLHAEDLNIFRELDHKNTFLSIVDGEAIYTDGVLDPANLIKTGNYVNYVMPILQNVLSSTK